MQKTRNLAFHSSTLAELYVRNVFYYRIDWLALNPHCLLMSLPCNSIIQWRFFYFQMLKDSKDHENLLKEYEMIKEENQFLNCEISMAEEQIRELEKVLQMVMPLFRFLICASKCSANVALMWKKILILYEGEIISLWWIHWFPLFRSNSISSRFHSAALFNRTDKREQQNRRATPTNPSNGKPRSRHLEGSARATRAEWIVGVSNNRTGRRMR